MEETPPPIPLSKNKIMSASEINSSPTFVMLSTAFQHKACVLI